VISDIVFEVNGKKCCANSKVLQFRAPFFYELYQVQNEEKDLKVEFPFAILCSLIQWVYTDQIESNDYEHLVEVWEKAVLFQMRRLIKYVQNKLIMIFQEDYRKKDIKDWVGEVYKNFLSDKGRYLTRYSAIVLLQKLPELLLLKGIKEKKGKR